MEVYSVKYKQHTIAKIVYEKHNFNYEPGPSISGLNPIYNYPPLLFGFNQDRIPTSEIVFKWLSRRVICKDRDDLGLVLKEAGLSYHNVWSLNKFTKSMTFEDYYWITDNEFDKFEDVHIRYLMETGQEDKIKELQRLGKALRI